MVFGLTLACQAQTILRLNLEAVHDYDFATKSWGEALPFTEVSYIQYVKGLYFHVHLPDLEQDYDARILKEKSELDADGDMVYTFAVSSSRESTEPAMVFRLVVPKDRTANKTFYMTVPNKFNFGFTITEVVDLTSTNIQSTD